MASIKRAITSSILSTDSPESRGERQRELESIKNPVKRTGMLALHGAVVKKPDYFAYLMGFDYVPGTMREIGRGADSSVYRVGEQVLKVNRESIFMSPQERQAYARTEAERHKLLAAHVGDVVLPHNIFIGPHPVLTSEAAVQITQRFVTGFDPGLFSPGSPDINHENLASLRDQNPSAVTQLADFAEHSMALFDEHGLIADTNGVKNLIINGTGDLLMIDSTPIGRENADIQELIARQTYSLAVAAQN